jgi:hypothetical protein
MMHGSQLSMEEHGDGYVDNKNHAGHVFLLLSECCEW